MILYHGTYLYFDKIDLSKSNHMSEIEYMNECTIRDVITMLVEKRNMSVSDAIDIFYNSQTFVNLNNTETGLYFQSPIYIYDLLEKEIG